MDIKKKPFAELYLDALCDNLKASMEIHRRIKDGDGVPQSAEAAEWFAKKFAEPLRWPQELPVEFMKEYFLNVDDIPIEKVEEYPVYEGNPNPPRQEDDQDLFEHGPKDKRSPLWLYLHLSWLAALAEAYDYYPIDKSYGRGLGFPRFIVAWAIEALLRQNDIQSQKDGFLTRAFHRFHPDYFESLGLKPIYEKDDEGAYKDICYFIHLLGKKGPLNIGYRGDFYSSSLTWATDDRHKPYLPNEIVGEILYSQGDERWKEYLTEKQLEALLKRGKRKAAVKGKLQFIGDRFYFDDETLPSDGQWHELTNVSFRVSPQKDGTYLVEYHNARYKNTQFGKQNWGDATLDQSTGEMKVDPGVEYKLNLIYPRYEYATGYTNNFCTCKIKIV